MTLCGLERTTEREIVFTVYGRPAQMGSKRAFVRQGRAVMLNDNSDRLRQWYNAVASKAAEVMHGRQQVTGPVRLSITFLFKRPKGHYGSGKNAANLKDSSPFWHQQKPDLDKLIRSTQDALSSVVWRDDCQVCQFGTMNRQWAMDGVEGADIHIEVLTPMIDTNESQETRQCVPGACAQPEP